MVYIENMKTLSKKKKKEKRLQPGVKQAYTVCLYGLAEK